MEQCTARIVAGVCAVACFAPGCAHTSDREDDLERQVRDLREQTDALARRADQKEAEIRDLRTRLDIVERNGGALAATRPAVKTAARRPREEVEEVPEHLAVVRVTPKRETRPAAASKPVDDEDDEPILLTNIPERERMAFKRGRVISSPSRGTAVRVPGGDHRADHGGDSDADLRKLAVGLDPIPMAGRETAAPETESATPTPAGTDLLAAAAPAADKKAAGEYQSAYNSFVVGRYDEAAQRFEKFVTSHNGHELLPNARYYLGESQFELKQYEKAGVTFSAMAEDFPESALAPDAMLRWGQALKAQGKSREAKDVLDALIRLYPQSRAGRQARSSS